MGDADGIVPRGGSGGWIRGGSRWIGVDQGWIMEMSSFEACAKHWETWQNAHGQTSCGQVNLSLYKIKRKERSISGAQHHATGRTRGRCVLEIYAALLPDAFALRHITYTIAFICICSPMLRSAFLATFDLPDLLVNTYLTYSSTPPELRHALLAAPILPTLTDRPDQCHRADLSDGVSCT